MRLTEKYATVKTSDKNKYYYGHMHNGFVNRERESNPVLVTEGCQEERKMNLQWTW